MKFYIISILLVAFSSCAVNKTGLSQVNEMNKSQPIEDSVIENLRQQNDVLLIAATVNMAWAKNISYHILAKKGSEWKGISYFKNKMPNGNPPDVINDVAVDKQVCESILQMVETNKAWTITGDEGKDFCADKKCMIYDAAIKLMMITTPSGYSAATYYAPEYFEECCKGNPQRALFVLITGKIDAMFQSSGNNAEM